MESDSVVAVTHADCITLPAEMNRIIARAHFNRRVIRHGQINRIIARAARDCVIKNVAGLEFDIIVTFAEINEMMTAVRSGYGVITCARRNRRELSVNINGVVALAARYIGAFSSRDGISRA